MKAVRNGVPEVSRDATFQPSTLRRRALPPLAALALLCLSGCAQMEVAPGGCTASASAHDPAESVNRGLFAFNRVLDDYALKPVARGYEKLPEPVRGGVHGFVDNFGEPKVFVNDLLQGNLKRSANTLGRFGVNTIFGVLGIVDVAERWGMPHHRADFGQTFGVWGVGDGPVLELPLLGSHNSRDSLGVVMGMLLDPLGGIDSDTYDALATASTVGGVVDGRAEALPLTERLERQPDYYAALRDAIAQRRAVLVSDGRQGDIHSSVDARCATPLGDSL
ncbi:MlaA family lipoprotein [Pseudomonas kuykendallii]|uniref:MlaA family lipoprotein n=2 Tax=Pseudomonas TaxID=286 RepID=UPI0036F303AB